MWRRKHGRAHSLAAPYVLHTLNIPSSAIGTLQYTGSWNVLLIFIIMYVLGFAKWSLQFLQYISFIYSFDIVPSNKDNFSFFEIFQHNLMKVSMLPKIGISRIIESGILLKCNQQSTMTPIIRAGGSTGKMSNIFNWSYYSSALFMLCGLQIQRDWSECLEFYSLFSLT